MVVGLTPNNPLKLDWFSAALQTSLLAVRYAHREDRRVQVCVKIFI